MAELELKIGGTTFMMSDEKGKEFQADKGEVLKLESVEFPPKIQELQEELSGVISKEDVIATLKSHGIDTVRVEEELNKNKVMVMEKGSGTTIIIDNDPDRTYTFEGKLPDDIVGLLKEPNITDERIIEILKGQGIDTSEVDVIDEEKGVLNEAKEVGEEMKENRVGYSREEGKTDGIPSTRRGFDSLER